MSTRIAAAAEENICVRHGRLGYCCTAVAIIRLYDAGVALLYYRYAGAANFSCCLAFSFCCGARIFMWWSGMIYDLRVRRVFEMGR